MKTLFEIWVDFYMKQRRLHTAPGPQQFWLFTAALVQALTTFFFFSYSASHPFEFEIGFYVRQIEFSINGKILEISD